MIRILTIVLGLFFVISCKKDIPVATLKNYIENDNLKLSDQWLIACSAGNYSNENLLTSIFYYPVEGAHNIKYFESNSDEGNDFSTYRELNPENKKEFNGYLERFKRIGIVGKWAIITYIVNDSLRISDPIKLKTFEKPTELKCEMNRSDLSFEWKDGTFDDNVIYFQIISDKNNNLLSGTYTLDKQFTYKDYSNVTISITDEKLVPELVPGETYTFTLMAVSDDNWVNLFCESSFSI